MAVQDLTKIAAGARPDLIAYEHAARVPLNVAVKELLELLGARLVAYIASVAETRTVREWAEEVRAPRDPELETKLRLGLHIALTIARTDHRHVVASWFQGLNPHLDDRSPARLLREGDPAEVGPLILSAARVFVSEG
jgi:hypothetical protein